MEPRNRFQGTNSSRLCSLAGRYCNPIPILFLASRDCLKIPAQDRDLPVENTSIVTLPSMGPQLRAPGRHPLIPGGIWLLVRHMHKEWPNWVGGTELIVYNLNILTGFNPFQFNEATLAVCHRYWVDFAYLWELICNLSIMSLWYQRAEQGLTWPGWKYPPMKGHI
jgi:hypothetical protein